MRPLDRINMKLTVSTRSIITGAFVTAVAFASAAIAQSPREPGVQRAAQQKPAKPAPVVTHRLAIQVAENNPQTMNLALNNAKNVLEFYRTKGEKVEIEIVTFGPGLHMLRDDTSPVKARIAEMSLAEPTLRFIACANTQANQSKQEQKPVTLITEAKLQPSGVVRIMELQKQGYAYIRP